MTTIPIIARTSDAYVPCVVVYPNGETRRGSVMAGRLLDVATARAELAAGRWVTVSAGDVEAVRGG